MSRSKPDPVDRSKTGADFLQLHLAEAPPGGLSDWLAERLRRAIADGRLPVGSKLPPSRVLAEELRVSRGVITEAYQRLTEDGQIAGRGRAGTIVLAAPLAAHPATNTTTHTAAHTISVAYSDIAAPGDAARVTAPDAAGAARSPFHPRSRPGVGSVFWEEPAADVFESLRAGAARIDLTPGVPDLTAFPRAAWLRAERQVLARLSPGDFGYGDPRGARPFRDAVAHWLARNRGIRAEPDDVVIVAGVSQALGLVAGVLLDEGIDEIALEDPGSLGVRQHLQSHRLATTAIPVDAAGLRVDALRASGAPAVVLTPAHQFPTGVVLDGPRRRELLRWAREGGLLLEDDYDAEHRYDRPPVPAVYSLLPEQVFYTGSVSKILAPALRVGWLLAPPRYRDAIIARKRYADLGNAVLPQLVLAELMETGAMERHLRMLRNRHRRRRDAMIEAIGTHLPRARVHGAAAGLHLMITFDAAVRDTQLAAEALARGVKTQPLSWHYQQPGEPGLVLGYAACTPSDAAEGIAILGRVVREALG
ncbi:PLP-dependent aminotransferase family protein [Actinocrinis puniceicyclus]|uniref:PLP-dependent aminotransferase family protein n=1 Tax=Actinocrinis puniceicyclus TaxID=977794 RepID=A0A8J7WST2_9ACTN|nr:PLP-dependent aminotransferase family protein [Actinocrinis puniceicyclus]MBS2965342.1 PLP-dependent aminotransferase family protein [Actinocrinis puniceicyclus]